MFLGYQAGYNDIGNENIVIGYNVSSVDTSGNYQLRIGNSQRDFIVGNSSGFIGIGTTTPTVSLQVATSTANATTTIEVGKTDQNKGSCLKMYDVAGTLQYVSIQGGSFAISATSCE